MLACTGRSKDAVLYLQRAKRLDPLDISICVYLSVALLNSYRTDGAVAEARRGLTLGASEGVFFLMDFFAALQVNDRQRAAAIINGYFKLNGNQPDATMLKSAEVLVMENKEAALDELKAIAKDSSLSRTRRVLLAHIASSIGQSEFALECLLEQRVQVISPVDLAFWHPIHRPLRQLPAFKTFLQDRGIVDYWRTTGHWADLCHLVGDDDFECE